LVTPFCFCGERRNAGLETLHIHSWKTRPRIFCGLQKGRSLFFLWGPETSPAQNDKQIGRVVFSTNPSSHPNPFPCFLWVLFPRWRAFVCANRAFFCPFRDSMKRGTVYSLTYYPLQQPKSFLVVFSYWVHEVGVVDLVPLFFPPTPSFFPWGVVVKKKRFWPFFFELPSFLPRFFVSFLFDLLLFPLWSRPRLSALVFAIFHSS